MRILITGGSGFIGRHLTEALLRKGGKVRVLDIDTAGIADLQKDANLEIIEGDITDKLLLENVVERMDCVFHLASIHLSLAVPNAHYRRVNVEATKNLLEICHRKNVRRFVHCSSVGVYGTIKSSSANEESACAPESIYDVTKLEGEQQVLRFHRETGFPAVVVRPAWVYGPGCPRTLRLFKAIKRRRFFFIGDGTTLRHPIYVSDVVEGFELCTMLDKAVGQIYILAASDPIPIGELVTKIATILRVPPPRMHIPLGLTYPLCLGVEQAFKILRKQPPISRRTLGFFTNNASFDTSKAKQELGFNARVSVDEGLRLIHHWILAQGGC